MRLVSHLAIVAMAIVLNALSACSSPAPCACTGQDPAPTTIIHDEAH